MSPADFNPPPASSGQRAISLSAPMSTLSDAIESSKSLTYEVLLADYEALQTAHAKKTNDEERLKNELELAQSELRAVKNASQDTKKLHDEACLQVEELQGDNRSLLARVASLREQLLAHRDRNKSLYGYHSKFKKEIAELSLQNQDMKREALKQQSYNELLKNREQQLVNQLEELRAEMHRYKNEHWDIVNTQQQQYQRLLQEKTTIEQERDDLRVNHANLSSQLGESQMQNEMMMRQLETTQDERDRLKKHVEDTKSTFQSSIRSLEQQREMELKDLEKARDALKEQQTAEKAILEENQSLKAELIQCRKRLLPLSGDDASSPQDQQQLLDELIQLRKEHTKLSFETKSLQGDNQRWVEAYDKISQDYNDVSSNNERLRGELSALREQLRQTGESDAHLAQEVEWLKSQLNEVAQQKETLDISLRNATYQLKYLLRDAQSRNQYLPPGFDDSSSITDYTSTTPSVSHERTVFHDVDELFKKNQELLLDVTRLRKELERLSTESDRIKNEHQQLAINYQHDTQQASSKITELEGHAHNLQSSLDKAIKDNHLYKQMIQDHLRDPHHANHIDADALLHDYKEKLEEYEREREEQNHAMEAEIATLKEELKQNRQSVITATSDRQQAEVREKGLMKTCGQLKEALNSSQLELVQQKQQVNVLTQQLNDQQKTLKEIHAEYLSAKEESAQKNLELANINTQLAYVQQLHQKRENDYTVLQENHNQLQSLYRELQLQQDDSHDTQLEHMESLRTQTERQRREISSLKEELRLAEEELRTMTNVHMEREKSTIENLRNELKRLKLQYEETQAELMQLRAKMADQETMEPTTRPPSSSSAGNEDDIQVLRERTHDYEQRYIHINDRIVKMKADYDALLDDLRGKLHDAKMDAQQRESKLKESEAVIEENEMLKQSQFEAEQRWTKELEEMKTQVESLQSDKQTLEVELASLRNKMELAERQYQTLQSDYERERAAHLKDTKTIESLQVQVRTLNGSLSEARVIIFKTEGRLRKLELQWTSEKEEWAKMEVSLRSELDTSRHQLLKITQLHDQLLATITKETGHHGGSALSDLSNKAVTELRSSMDGIVQENDRLYAQYKQALVTSEEHQKQLQVVVAKLELTEAQVHQLQKTNLELEEKYAATMANATSTLDATTATTSQYVIPASLEKKLSEAESAKHDLEKQLVTAKEELAKASDRIQSLEKQINESIATTDLLAKAKQEWNIRTSQILNKYNKADPTEVQMLKDEQAKLQSQILNMEQEKTISANKIAELEAKVKNADETAIKYQRAAAGFKRRWESAQADLKKLEGDKSSDAPEKQAMEEKLKKLTQESEQLQRSNTKLNKDLTDLRAKHKSLMERAKKEIAEKKKASEELEKAQNEMQEIKKQMDEAKTQVENVQKQLELEQGRSKVMQSMSNKKIAKLQDELDALAPHKRAREDDNVEQPAAKR